MHIDIKQWCCLIDDDIYRQTSIVCMNSLDCMWFGVKYLQIYTSKFTSAVQRRAEPTHMSRLVYIVDLIKWVWGLKNHLCSKIIFWDHVYTLRNGGKVLHENGGRVWQPNWLWGPHIHLHLPWLIWLLKQNLQVVCHLPAFKHQKYAINRY